MSKTGRIHTRIGGSSTHGITVRGRNLVTDLMGKVSFSQMILLQLSGRMPARRQVKILDAVLVTIMEHGLTPSAIATRLTIHGAPESVQGAVAAGLLGVGDRFAGTASACALLLDQLAARPRVARAALAKSIVTGYVERREYIPGFGHPVHRKGDPRVARLLDIVRKAGARGDHLHALSTLEKCVRRELDTGLVTNVSAALAVALAEIGVPAAAMRGIILTARCAGLAGHLYEESVNPIAGVMTSVIEKEIPYRK